MSLLLFLKIRHLFEIQRHKKEKTDDGWMEEWMERCAGEMDGQIHVSILVSSIGLLAGSWTALEMEQLGLELVIPYGVLALQMTV